MRTSTSRTLLLSFFLALAAACGGTDVAEPSVESASESAIDTRRERVDVIECRSDDPCPRGSYCETGLHFCFTPSRCVVAGRPSDRFCERTYGEGFVCLEYGVDSFHCVPTE